MMRENRFMVVGVVALAAMVVVVALLWRGNSANPPAVVLPTEQAGGNTGETYNVFGRAEVTPDTVQAVIETLDRAEAYSRTAVIEDFWDTGSSSLQLRQWQTTGSTRIRIERAAEAENILFTGGRKYIWYDKAAGSFESQSSGTDAEADRYMRCLTYEDLLEMPAENILDAGYSEYSGESCVWARYRSDVFGYENTVYVSVNTGLLMGTETYDGDTLIYRMTSGAVDTTPPDKSWFALPEADAE